MRTLMSKIWHLFFLFPIVAGSIVLIIFITIQLTLPLEPIHSVRMDILNPKAKAGEVVRFNAHVCKEVDTASELHYGLTNIEDKRYYYAGMEYGINPKGCFSVEQHFNLPPDIPPGHYQVDVIGHIRINALREEQYRLPMGILTVERNSE